MLRTKYIMPRKLFYESWSCLQTTYVNQSTHQQHVANPLSLPPPCLKANPSVKMFNGSLSTSVWNFPLRTSLCTPILVITKSRPSWLTTRGLGELISLSTFKMRTLGYISTDSFPPLRENKNINVLRIKWKLNHSQWVTCNWDDHMTFFLQTLFFLFSPSNWHNLLWQYALVWLVVPSSLVQSTIFMCISTSQNSSVMPEWNHLTLSLSSRANLCWRNSAPACALAWEFKKTKNLARRGSPSDMCCLITKVRSWYEPTGFCILCTAKKILGWSIESLNIEVWSSQRCRLSMISSIWDGGIVAVPRWKPTGGFWLVLPQLKPMFFKRIELWAR